MSFSPGHALLIGVGSYIHYEAVTNLPNTVEDVRQLAALLTDPAYCGYPAEQVTVLHNEQATRASVLAALDHLVATTTADSTVLIYYAGHGHYDAPADATDRTYFLTTHETDLTPEPPTAPTTATANRWIVPDTAISQAELLAALQRIRAERVLLLFNACHAGELHPTMSLGAAPASTVQSRNPPEPLAAALLGTGSGRVIMTACRDSHVSQAGPGPTTIFAEYLLAALQGQDVPNRQGTISVFDLYQTVYARVKARVLDRYYRHQEPVLTMLRGVGPFPVALYQGATSLGIADTAASPPEGDAVRLISIQASQQALATLLSRMDTKLDQLGRRLDRLTLPPPPAPDPLVEAQKRFASLPRDHVPAPTPYLPACSRLPLTRNPHFVGRTADLVMLTHGLADPDPPAIPILVLTGIGGCGKTSVAVEWAYRYGSYFAGGVFWISCAIPTAIAEDVAACGTTLGLPPTDGALAAQVAAVRRVWQEPLPRLLIFDSCSDPQDLVAWLPTVGGCRVIVTSRWRQWPFGLPIAITILAREDSLRLVQSLAPSVPAADADALATLLSDFPLALHLAARYLAQSPRRRVEAYLDEVRQTDILGHPSFAGADPSLLPTRHDQHVGRTFLISYQLLVKGRQRDPLARHLLTHMSWYAPGEPIVIELLLKTLPPTTSQDVREHALTHLLDLGFVEADGAHHVRMHRLIQTFVQQITPAPQAAQAVAAVLCSEAEAINDAWDPRLIQPLLPHLRWLCDHMSPTDVVSIRVLHVLSEHALYARTLTDALALCQTAYERSVLLVGSTHPLTARSLHNQGTVLAEQGDLAAAQALLDQALALRTQLLGSTHPDHATTLHNLAVVHHEQGHLALAQQQYADALAIRMQTLGPTHPATLRTRQNLAGVLQALAQYPAAQAAYEEVIATLEATLGSGHPALIPPLLNLARLLQRRNDTTAITLYERAHHLAVLVYGITHPTTVITLHRWAACLYARGELSTAQTLVTATIDRLRSLPADAAVLTDAVVGDLYILAAQVRQGT